MITITCGVPDGVPEPGGGAFRVGGTDEPGFLAAGLGFTGTAEGVGVGKSMLGGEGALATRDAGG
jgi:hypothetical protein